MTGVGIGAQLYGPRGADGTAGLAARLRRELSGEVLFDPFSRGRYSTDASMYQITPVGVVVPRTADDVRRLLALAADVQVPLVPRGGGTSQGGQAIGEGLVVDVSKHLTGIRDFNPEAGTVRVEPGVILDRLNAYLKPHGLWFPVDPATAAQATIGGMAGNNSAGARSLRYGLMADNVRAIRAVLPGGREYRFGELPENLADAPPLGGSPDFLGLARALRAIYLAEADELARRAPRVMRHVAGYALQRVGPPDYNLARLLVGSEGTLAFFTEIELALRPLPGSTVLGVCHFPALRGAMDAVQHVVRLGPSAVELVDATLLGLARENATFRGAIGRFVRGTPEALLLVEFSGGDATGLERDLGRLEELMGELGLPKAVVRAVEPGFQREVWSVRKQGLNIVMSMKGDAKPASFIEDCAVPLEHLGEYTARLSEVFRRHGTSGTWYAHASVGCLHIRPSLNLKDAGDVKKLRIIAEEAHALVREFKGSHSGEHGDGIVRSEFLEPMLGSRLVRAFEEVKRLFDPLGLLNPGKIVRPPRMDDRSLLRYMPGYAARPLTPALDWSPWGGLLGAVEMCNNNGACRRVAPDVMCPSYRVTRDERDSTRGRANTLRLALTGQLGPAALASDEMYETLDLCVGCKACRRECPTGVDMARMKIEVLHQRHRRRGVSFQERLVGYLPRYAPWAARLPWLAHLRNRSTWLAGLGERWLGVAARRSLPVWAPDAFHRRERGGRREGTEHANGKDVVLWVDTFNNYFEPANADAAVRVLEAAGYHVILPAAADRGRPICCGRTFLSVGLVDEAKAEARRVIETLRPYVERGVPVVGLEPSCLLTVRDEYPAMLHDPAVARLADRAVLLEEFLAGEAARGELRLTLTPQPGQRALLHGHCHQKAFGAMPAVERTLRLVPGLEVEVIDSSCCGMAGAFGYGARHYDVSMRMADLSLLPAVRAAPADAWIVADGTSCRHQIHDGAGREAVHVVRVLDRALALPGLPPL
jgi:FAD/FMN-containing dehydrogenase/Fe-S oxidoreductase